MRQQRMVYMGEVGGQITHNLGYAKRRDVKIRETVHTASNRHKVSNGLQTAVLPKLLVGDVRKPLRQESVVELRQQCAVHSTLPKRNL